MRRFWKMIGEKPIALILLLLWPGSSCHLEEGMRNICTGDQDCPPGFRCDSLTGLCLCTTNDVCGPDEYCHPDGRCRRRMSCDNNLDCPDGTFCDTSTGNCVENGKCTRDVHCPIGKICSEVYFQCISGCRSSGDCPLRSVCQEGECRSDVCPDKTYCDYGELCDPQTSKCVPDERGPFCASCKSATIYEPYSCGEGPNFCLVKGGDLTLEPYCGVDCSEGQDCPNGYDCFSVRIVYTRDNCDSDEDCAPGKCLIKEGDKLGFCLCNDDSQCPQDNSCDETTLQCRITHKFCTPGGSECRPNIPCIDGYCHIGWNCKPVEGLRCEDIAP